MDGVVLIDKPRGITSFDVVKVVRKAADEKRVGHAGTLDPLASGLMAVMLGQGTKLSTYLMECEKRYVGVVAFGTSTDTDDCLGQVLETAEVPLLNEALVRDVLTGFRGKIYQVPPAYSALKQQGEPLYKKARRGEEVLTKEREVEVVDINLIDLLEDEISIDVRCKKGTYIRALARDIGVRLGTRAHLRALRRTEASGFSVSQGLLLSDFTPQSLAGNLMSLKDALFWMPMLELDKEQESRITKGQSLKNPFPSFEIQPNTQIRLVDTSGRLLAIGLVENSTLRPMRVMVY